MERSILHLWVWRKQRIIVVGNDHRNSAQTRSPDLPIIGSPDLGLSSHQPGFLFFFPQLNLLPIIALMIKWSVEWVTPTPTPKLSSQLGETFKSIAGKICCPCSATGSKLVIGPSAP